MGEYKTTLDLRTIRNVVVKQTKPEGSSSIFEIFSRLNTGGINLSQQEIRASLYHSDLMSRALKLNENANWRRLLDLSAPDSRMRDSEIILRSFALARNLDKYSGSMASFVNRFCLEAQQFSREQVMSAVKEFEDFLNLTSRIPDDTFMRQTKFSGLLFESFFSAWVRTSRVTTPVELHQAVREVKEGPEFPMTLQEGSTKSANVKKRVEIAEQALTSQ